MFGRRDFESRFAVGEIINSGGPRSKLEIKDILDRWVVVVPILSRDKAPVRLNYEQLDAVIDGFDEIDPKRIEPTIQPVLKKRGLKQHTTENYIYGFAREYRSRSEQMRLRQQQELPDILPEEIPNTSTVKEGAKKVITVNAYERDPAARARCIAKWGTRCDVCWFNFGKTYGELGEGFIHVHHLKPLSEIKQEYDLNPLADLRPVCPNCHAMLHRKKAVLSIEELREILKNQLPQ